MARFALGTLIFSGSVEAAVRSVLRIAAAKNHFQWQIWAHLQLTELFEDETNHADGVDELKRTIFSFIPDGARTEDIFRTAERSYSATRKDPDGRSYGADIASIELDTTMFTAELHREINLDRIHQRDRNHRILNRVKNSAQQYLMMVEAGTTPPEL